VTLTEDEVEVDLVPEATCRAASGCTSKIRAAIPAAIRLVNEKVITS